MILTFDIIGFIFGVIGAILLGKKNRIGFIAFIIGSSAHGLLGFLTGNYGLMATCVVFIIIDLYYFREWGKTMKPETVCRELVNRGLMSKTELKYEKAYLGASVPSRVYAAYVFLIKPVAHMMRRSQSFSVVMNSIARFLFINRAIRKGKEVIEKRRKK